MRRCRACWRSTRCPAARWGSRGRGRWSTLRASGGANREQGEAVRAESRFRPASVSKPITAAAVLRLCEQGKLTLDEAVLPRLKLKPFSGTLGDPRWTQDHRAPAARPHRRLGQETQRRTLSSAAPRSCRDLGPALARRGRRRPPRAGTMLGRPLESDPGSAYAYPTSATACSAA